MNNELSKTIGMRINTLLGEQDKKQKDLAAYLGVTDNTISYFVSGKRKPNTEQLLEIARFFETTTDYLLGLSTVSTNDKDLQFICDYTGLDEETIEHISVKSYVMLPTANSRLSFYKKLPKFLAYTDNEYFEYYTKSMNDFLQSGCLYEIANACSYEKILEYCFNEIQAFENSGIKLEEMSEYKRAKLHMCVDIFMDFYEHHTINLFTVQNSILDFIKSTTSILQSPNDIDEVKKYAESLWQLEEEISELREAYSKNTVEPTFFGYPINDITSIVDCFLDKGVLQDYTIGKLLAENDELSEKEKEDLLINFNRELKERGKNGNNPQT